MKIKTSELSGKALDYAVALFIKPEWLGNQHEVYVLQCGFNPSSNWSQGGPIIEREKIQVSPHSGKWCSTRIYTETALVVQEYGDTPLIAAMRCYVASKLGDSVDVPDDLL